MPSNDQKYDTVYSSPIAPLGIKMQGERISSIDWLPESVQSISPLSESIRAVIKTLDIYFDNPTALPEFSFTLTGTEFQKRVWRALKDIPVGQVMTYGELAGKLKTSSRAIGQACRTNPICILIPCHRVIAAKGLGGYMGHQRQLQIKRWLLEHERVACH